MHIYKYVYSYLYTHTFHFSLTCIQHTQTHSHADDIHTAEHRHTLSHTTYIKQNEFNAEALKIETAYS